MSTEARTTGYDWPSRPAGGESLQEGNKTFLLFPIETVPGEATVVCFKHRQWVLRNGISWWSVVIISIWVRSVPETESQSQCGDDAGQLAKMSLLSCKMWVGRFYSHFDF